MKAKKEVIEQEQKEKIVKLKEKVERGVKLFSLEQMLPVYKKRVQVEGNVENSEKDKEKKKEKKDVNGNSSHLSAAKRKSCLPSEKISKKHKKS